MKPVAVLVVLAAVSGAFAQVSCDDPDNLCTGDPCVMDNVEVMPPCVVDFGARTLIIRDRLSRAFNPASSLVSLTAGAITVESGTDVAATMLAASGPLDFDGHGGFITLEAGGVLTMGGSLNGGTLTLHGAGGVVVTGPVSSRASRSRS